MAAWHSLSGYLQLRPSGALGRWKSRRRHWYVLDEESCQLVFYRSEAEASSPGNRSPSILNPSSTTTKRPLGAIPLKHAAISLVLEEDNQFVIHSEGKEYTLTADNHESMMIWVMALQAKREEKRIKDAPSAVVRTESCKTGAERAPMAGCGTLEPSARQRALQDPSSAGGRLFRTHSLQLGRRTTPPSSPRWWRAVTPPARQPSDGPRSPGSKPRQFLDGLRLSLKDVVPDANNNRQRMEEQAKRARRPQRPPKSSSGSDDSSSSGSCNNVVDGESCPEVLELDATEACLSRDASSPEEGEGKDAKARHLRHLNAPATRQTDKTTSQKEKASRSVSGASVSSDSAVGGGSSSGQCVHSLRVLGLEAELISVKDELSRCLTREATLKKRLADEGESNFKMRRRIQQARAAEASKRNSTSDAVGPGQDVSQTSHVRHPSGGSETPSMVRPQQRPEQERILQNLNRFLNEEVLKLSRLLQENQQKMQSQSKTLAELESSLESFKRDYVFLMQSSLRISCAEGPEQQEVYLYGGRRHKERVLCLLEESRRRNPTLPVYDRCSPCLCHVDPLGFRHFLTEESLALHYICCQLHHHYSTSAAEAHQQRWKDYLRAHLHLSYLETSKELKSLVRRGIPASLRPRVWCLLYKARVQDLRDAKGSHYYNTLCTLAPDSTVVAQHKRQISLDLLRTMPNNIRFSDQNADGVRKMQEVLQAFCLHNPALGYCQGMNFLAGMCLLFMEPENAFWCLVAIAERYFPSGYFDLSLIGAQADQEVLKDLVREKLPALHRHLAQLDIELCTVTLNWFLAIFFDVVPMESLLRIWDCFLLEGPKSLFRFSLAMMKLQESAILSKKDTVSVMRQLKSASKLTYDVDALFQIAFEELEPFPRRKDIVAKQAYYYRCIQERNKKREAEKAALHARETLFSEADGTCQTTDTGGSFGYTTTIECAAVFDQDKLWLVHGHEEGAQVSKVNCEECTMYRLNRQFDSRVMCMHALDDDVMLLGTLSHFLYGYSTRSRKLLWEVHLNDSVLSLCSQQEDSVKQIFAGLADGTVAVVENMEGPKPNPETFYILVGSNPVTCLCLVDRRLWCACGNRMIILNARTLDNVDSYQTSCSSMDYISLVKEGPDGIWVTLRGSSVLQLWDPKSLTCRLLFDIHTNTFAKWTKEDPSIPAANSFRITSVLPLENSLLVGTAEGSLLFYEVKCRNQSRPPSSVDEPEPDSPTEQQNLPEVSTDDAIDDVDIPFRERNDSGCYSANTAISLSRRASGAPEVLSNGGESDPTRYTLSEEHSEGTRTLVQSSSHSGTDTIVSPLETAWEQEISTECMETTIKTNGFAHFEDDVVDQEVCRSLDLDSRTVRRFVLRGSLANTDREIDSEDCLSNEWIKPSGLSRFNPAAVQTSMRTYSTILRDISKGSRRNRSVSLSDIRRRGSDFRKRGLTISVDDLQLLTNGESTALSSSVTSGSYDFDDLLIPYTEDENGKGLPDFSLQDAETLIRSLRLKNCFGVSDQGKDERTLDSEQVLPTAMPVIQHHEEKLYIKHIDSWNSFKDNGQKSSSTYGYSNDDASTPDVPDVDPFRFLKNDLLPSECANQLKHVSSDTSSNLSANSDVSYVFDLVMQEKIKISDKPIKCLLVTRSEQELSVVSCAGCYGDDEAVLKWTQEGKERLWTNDPVVEVCPYTNAIRPSPFARSRMPRRTSLQPTLSAPLPLNSNNTQRRSPSVSRKARSASVNVGYSLARVQSMFSRTPDKT